MKLTPKELREKRVTLINNARAIYDAATEGGKEPDDEQRTQFDTAMKAASELKVQIDNAEKDEKRLLALNAEEAALEESKGRQTSLQTANSSDEGRTTEPKTIELRKSVKGFGRSVIVPMEQQAKAYVEDFRNYLMTALSTRALQKDVDTGGGYLSAPVQFMAELIKFMDNNVFMRTICNVLPPIATADSLGAPSLDNDPADPDWTGEISTTSEDSTMSFGKRELTPKLLAKMIKVSKRLLLRSAMPIDAIVRDRLGYKFSVVQENAFLNGTGAAEPLGVFTASDNGIPTGRDVSTGNETDSIKFDGLKNAEFSLKVGHRRLAQWIFHRDGVLQISKLKDGEGRYIWQQSVQVGQPDRVLNMIINESEYAPNTFETGLYVGILGNFQNYWIVDALTFSIQVLLELYSLTNQNAYIGRLEADGMPVLAEAFARVKLG